MKRVRYHDVPVEYRKDRKKVFFKSLSRICEFILTACVVLAITFLIVIAIIIEL